MYLLGSKHARIAFVNHSGDLAVFPNSLDGFWEGDGGKEKMVGGKGRGEEGREKSRGCIELLAGNMKTF